ncbi:MAG: hypothetical protein ACJAWQ_001858 [Paraglaciecola sp.]|jgi:hypothetical protein
MVTIKSGRDVKNLTMIAVKDCSKNIKVEALMLVVV